MLIDDKDPLLVAAVIDELLGDPQAREDLVRRGQHRADELSLTHARAGFGGACGVPREQRLALPERDGMRAQACHAR